MNVLNNMDVQFIKRSLPHDDINNPERSMPVLAFPDYLQRCSDTMNSQRQSPNYSKMIKWVHGRKPSAGTKHKPRKPPIPSYKPRFVSFKSLLSVFRCIVLFPGDQEKEEDEKEREEKKKRKRGRRGRKKKLNGKRKKHLLMTVK